MAHYLARRSTATLALLVLVLLAALGVTGAAPARAGQPSQAITVDASTIKGTTPAEIFGSTMSAWDPTADGGDPVYNERMALSGIRSLRYPGGALADQTVWDRIRNGNNHKNYIDIDQALAFANKFGGTLQPVVNFSGWWTDDNGDYRQHSLGDRVAAAVAEVRHLKARQASARYWEIGNEEYGPWEPGGPVDGETYADGYAQFYSAMKMADPSIQIGAVAAPFSSQDPGNYDNFTEKMLAELKALGVVPDFLIVHYYPSVADGNRLSDAQILVASDRIATFTGRLDEMISNELGDSCGGAPCVGRIGYFMTEFRSSTFGDARIQSYVDTLFSAQAVMEMASSRRWIGANIFNLKGRPHDLSQGDYGLLRSGWDGAANDPNPAFYVYPLLANIFGRQVVNITGSNTLLRAYAAKDSNGNLTLFLVNDSPSIDATVNLNYTGLSSDGTATTWLVQPSDPANQESADLQINGTVHPDPASIAAIGKLAQVQSGTDITVPTSAMLLIRIDNNGGSAAGSPSSPRPAEVSRPAAIQASAPRLRRFGVAGHSTRRRNHRVLISYTLNTDAKVFGRVSRSGHKTLKFSTHGRTGRNQARLPRTISNRLKHLRYTLELYAVDSSGQRSATLSRHFTG